MTEEQRTIVLFDIGGVIVPYDHQRTIDGLVNLGVQPDQARKFFISQSYFDFSRGILDESEYVRRMNKEMNCSLALDQMREAHDLSLYGPNSSAVKLVEGVSASIGKDRVGLLTDTNHWQTDKERELVDLRPWAGHEFRSHELHRIKIDNGCFELVLEQLQRKQSPGSVLLIDDSPEKIERAHIAGLHTFHYHGLEKDSRLGDYLVRKGLLRT